MINGKNTIGQVTYCSKVLNNNLLCKIPITMRLPDYVSFVVGDRNIYLVINDKEEEFRIINVETNNDFYPQITCISEDSFDDNIEILFKNIIGVIAYRKCYIGEPFIGRDVRKYLRWDL